jgi:DNA modification methylase
MSNKKEYLEKMSYDDFLKQKIKVAIKTGFDIDENQIHPMLKPHQKDVVKWAIKGGNRAIFASFGLGKTIIQLEIGKQIISHKGGNALFVCPLGVKHEFQNDCKKIGIEELRYITNTNQISTDCQFYITNYERVRNGEIDPLHFTVSCFDEASVLRNLDTDTTQEMMQSFTKIPHRFVFTATPSPNEYLELINYAEYLGIMDRGASLTRFFQRDSTSAGNLTLYEKRKKEFWFWMSSWACFITKPSDLGYDDSGYDLPPIEIVYHKVSYDRDLKIDKYTNQSSFITDSSKDLGEASKEKRNSIGVRVAKMKEIIDSNDGNFLLWHHLEAERHEIQKTVGKDCKSVYGSQKIEEREDYLIGFAKGKYKYLSVKPQIAGSGCNFQYYCNQAIFVGIDFKFNDFIQAVHRIYRFLQKDKVRIHIIYTDAEEEILKALLQKWNNHITLQSEMTDIIKEYGLNTDLYQQELKRQMFEGRSELKTKQYHAINNDTVAECNDIKSNSVGLIVSSIPFGNHYEYSDNYNCFGHNEKNEDFFSQMDFLIPNLFRILEPGRIACIHVKDRIRYSYMNGTGFSTIEPFSDHTNIAFLKHGFHLMSRITITTDVVRENNQTYRLGWSEKCKDGTKMGAGLPEYLLVFRKPATDNSNAYADTPVTHSKKDYTRGRWQLDAHAHWNSNGERLFDEAFLRKHDLDEILKIWKGLEFENGYDYDMHVDLCEKLDKIGKLPTSFMSIPPQSYSNDVWTDVNRMNTLNSDQARRNLTKHICPLQIDIIKRCIERYSNKGDVVLDPFGGIMSVPYQAAIMDRYGVGIELNTDYYKDGLKHLKRVELKSLQTSLF